MCAPDDCYDFEARIASVGMEEALAERKLQFETMDLQNEYIESHLVEADYRPGGYYVTWYDTLFSISLS
eukprot:SAG31_NODE_17565_length_666_cov_1.178131_1_plen_68_part_10